MTPADMSKVETQRRAMTNQVIITLYAQLALQVMQTAPDGLTPNEIQGRLEAAAETAFRMAGVFYQVAQKHSNE